MVLVDLWLLNILEREHFLSRCSSDIKRSDFIILPQRSPLWLSTRYQSDSAGARAFKVGGPNLKVEELKFFIDFSPEKACRALMQLQA